MQRVVQHRLDTGGTGEVDAAPVAGAGAQMWGTWGGEALLTISISPRTGTSSAPKVCGIGGPSVSFRIAPSAGIEAVYSFRR